MKYSIIIFLIVIGLPLRGQPDWTLKKDIDGIKVYTKDRPSSSFKTFKATAKVDAPVEEVVRLFKAVEDMPKWYDKVSEANLLQTISKDEGIYSIVMDMPWPVRDRISVIKATMTYDASKYQYKVITRHEPSYTLDSRGMVVVTDIGSSWIIKASDNGTELIHEGYMDPAGIVPAWLAEDTVEKGPILTIQNLRKMVGG